MEDTSAPFLERLRRGDQEAWRQFRGDYLAFVERQLGRMLHDAAAIDEVAHDVFVVLADKLSAFERRGTGSFRAYLRSIVRFQCLAWLKRERGGHQAHGAGDSHVLDMLNQWDDPASDLSRLWDREHEELWSRRMLDEARSRCGETGKRDLAVFLALHSDSPNRTAIAEEHGVSESYTYKIEHKLNRVLSDIRRDWAEVLDLDNG